MSWIITGTQKVKGLLDEFSGAAAAYSLRDLTFLRGGPVVRVRRSSDNTEQDFTATQITDGTLTTFCGAGDGFVRTWYDQSGNGNHAGQTTTASQPQIFSSGSLVTDGTKPALLFNNGPFLSAPDSTSFRISNPSMFTVCSCSDLAAGIQMIAGKNFGGSYYVSYNQFFVSSKYRSGIYTGTEATVSSPNTFANNTQYLLFLAYTGAAVTGADNGSSIYSTARSGAILYNLPDYRIGRMGDGSFALRGKVQENIVWGSDQTVNRTAIESNINAHYNIF